MPGGLPTMHCFSCCVHGSWCGQMVGTWWLLVRRAASLHGTPTTPSLLGRADGCARCFRAHMQSSIEEIDLDHNQLTGPAFPPAWLAPNSTLNLESLWLSNNLGLEGSLPPSLNWSRLRVL